MTINTHSTNLPNMSDVIKSWETTYTAYLIKKEIINFELKETKRKIKFKGIIQNDGGDALDIKNKGERQFNHYKLHTTYKFNNDDIIEVENTRYRILTKHLDTTYYGFYHYSLVEDYINSTEIEIEEEEENE